MKLIMGLTVWITAVMSIQAVAQTDSLDAARLEAYQQRIKKSHINGFYIPADLNDAMETLDEIMDDRAKQKFAREEEDFAVRQSFFSFGTWMNVNWSLLEGSRLSANLSRLGIRKNDDLIWLLMRSYHRHLNSKPLDVEGQIQVFSNPVVSQNKGKD